jgi:hypothetical protein
MEALLEKEKIETPVEEIPQKKKKSAYWKTAAVIFSVTVILALTSFITPFCDWYANNAYIYLCDGLTYLTAYLPFCLGEMMMYLGVAMVIFSVIFLILLIFLRKKPKYRRFCGGYFKTFLMMLLCVLFLYMPMWLIPFRSSVMGEGDTGKRREFTYEEIYALLEYSINGLNQAAEEIEIAEDGKVLFPEIEETRPLINEALVNISEEFPRMRGFYPTVKTALCSDILERMWIGGYTYPFTMEATHNKYTSPTYQPILDAHELSHHKCYYKENEAEFVSQLALIKSDDPLLRFSAFDAMYSYVSEEFYETQEIIISDMIAEGTLIKPNWENKDSVIAYIEQITQIFGTLPEVSDRVHQINNAGYVIAEEIYEEDSHPIDEMPAVNEVIEETADVGWETQGEILQENTYDGVTLLLLQYFDGILY